MRDLLRAFASSRESNTQRGSAPAFVIISREAAKARRVWLGLSTLLLASLTGCGSPEQGAFKACIAVIETSERFPSTIKMVSQNADYKNLTADEFANEIAGGWPKTNFADAQKVTDSAPAPTVSELKSYPDGVGFQQASFLRYWLDGSLKADDLGIQSTKLEYDIDNGNGVPERKSANCKFPLSSVKSQLPMVSYDELVRLEKLRRQTYGFDPSVPNKGFPCCMPRFAFASTSPANSRFVGGELTGTKVAGGVVMYDEIELEVKNAMNALKVRNQGAQ